MPKFIVEVPVCCWDDYEVEAESAEEAFNKVFNLDCEGPFDCGQYPENMPPEEVPWTVQDEDGNRTSFKKG